MTKLSIELERQNGIFYAGEVVRGTVKLTTTGKEVTCRAFNIQLKGEARVHWHAATDADLRMDYDGSTVYQYQHLTVCGNFYKTGLLPNTGKDANFDTIHNLGVIQIPCSTAETQNLSLIVRAMDYDWGKKDELLGDVLVDVVELSQQGCPKTFPLTHTKGQQKGEITISAKYLPYDAIFPTSTHSGIAVSKTIAEDCCLVLRIHKATGLKKADDWLAGKNNVYIQVYRIDNAKSIGTVPGQKLPGPQKKVTIPADTEIIAPFAFALQQDAPPSVELGVLDRSTIRYKIQAYIDLADWKDPFTKVHITVIPNRPIPRPLLLQPHKEQVGPDLVYGCCCSAGKSGVATIQIQLGRLAYAAGETIDMSGSTILYEGNKEMMAEVVLTGYYQLNSYEKGTTTRREHSLGRIPLVCHSQTTLNDTNKNNKFIIPPVYPSFYRGAKEPRQRSHYSCLRWTYTIGIKVGSDDVFSRYVQVALPILISSAPPYSEALREHQHLTPKNVTFGIWDIFDHAVSDAEEACTTAPTITGPEDGGTVRAVGTPITTWEDQDDNNYVGSGEGQESMSYQPFIATFDGPWIK
jgi:hypothetical protein